MTATTSIKLKPDRRNASNASRPKRIALPHWLMHRAIEDYVDRAEKRRQFNEDSRAALEEYRRTGLHLTHEEVMEWMNKVIAGEHPPMPEPHT